MLHPSQNAYYPSSQYSVVLQGQNSKPLQTRPTKDQDWFFFTITRLASFLGILCVILSLVWVSTIMFVDNRVRLGYETTTFLTTIDKNNIDSWQVQTQSWSDITKTNVAVDTRFNHYFECWFAAGVAADRCANTTINEYKSCINTKFASSLTTCANNNDEASIAPTLNTYAKCIANELVPTRESINGLTICLRTSMWPLYESPENVDSWYFLGSYNWMTLLSIGFALFSCFVLYTGGFVIYAENINLDTDVQPTANGPLSYSITAVCAGFSLIFFTYFLINAYRLPDNNALGSTYPLPNSVATNNVMIPATLVVFVYFMMEFLEIWAPMFYKTDQAPESEKLVDNEGKPKQEAEFVVMTPNGPILQARHFPTKYWNPAGKVGPDEISWNGVMTMYYPALTLAWADAYMLDPILALGIIGATHQVSTALVYQIFVAILTYRMAHTSVSRLLYSGYILNPDESTSKYNKSDILWKDTVYSVRMQAMFMHLAATVSLVMLWYIITNDNLMLSEFSLVYSMLYLWYIIPEVIRLGAHIAVAFKAVHNSDRYILITCNYIIWIWDVIVRLIFMLIIIWGATSITATQGFIDTRLQNITDTIAYMAA